MFEMQILRVNIVLCCWGALVCVVSCTHPSSQPCRRPLRVRLLMELLAIARSLQFERRSSSELRCQRLLDLLLERSTPPTLVRYYLIIIFEVQATIAVALQKPCRDAVQRPSKGEARFHQASIDRYAARVLILM